MGSVLCVLFTDLSGSTELMTRLGDTAFDALRSEHFAGLREVVTGVGGTEIKNTGDGILATFTSAVDALATAARAQQLTDQQGRAAGFPLALRVGLALGEVAVENGDVFGTPVVEAARLVAAARPGQILATGLVRAVAGTRAGVKFGDLTSLELKGLPEPVPVCEVAWEPVAPARVAPDVPLPGLLLRTSRVFVGRTAELARLKAGWKEIARGGRALVLLGGEPGVGKTRLTARLAAALHQDGALVLAGRCDEDMGVPYQPFVEALRYYAHHAAQPLQLGRYPGELARVVPELAELVSGLAEPLRSDPETERYRLFEAVAGWLADLSSDAPVLLVLDDLHWAAKPTLLLLRHVLQSPEPMRLLLVATYRDTELGGTAFGDFLADVPRLDCAERLPVSGLDAATVAEFLEAAAGHALSDEGAALADTVWRETQGNSFFVAEVLRHLAESGALEQRDGRWSPTSSRVPIPDEVRDVVARRLGRLPDPAGRVLAFASVAGLEFDPAVVEVAGEFEEDEILAALDAATAARLVTDVPGPRPRNRFAHAIVRSTLYDQLGPSRRRSMHRRTAEAIASVHPNALDDHLPALAHHWVQAGGETEQAAEFAGRAAERALAQLAFDEAAGLFAQALDATSTEDARRLELLISLGDAQRRAGDPAHRETLMKAARLAQDCGDADALARTALASSRFSYWSRGGQLDQERVRLLETALEALGQIGSGVRARLLADLALELVWSGEWERRVALSDEAVRLAREIDDPFTMATVLIARFYAINFPGNLAARIADADELLPLAERLGDPLIQLMAHFLRARMSLESGDAGEIARHLPEAERFAAVVGQPTFRWMLGWVKSASLLLAGRVPEAEGALDAALALGRETGQPDAERVYLVQLIPIRFEQGRIGELEPTLSALSGHFTAIPGLPAVQALAACQSGAEAKVRAFYDRLRALDFELPRDPVWLGMLCAAAEVARHLRDTESAARLYALLSPYGTSFGLLAGTPVGCTAFFLGMLATMTNRFEAAHDHFRQADAIYDRADARAFLARSRVEWARMLMTRARPDDLARARALLNEASATAGELDLVEVERRAAAVRGMSA